MLMNPVICREFRMKRCGEQVPLLDQNREAISASKNLDLRPDALDAGCADKDSFKRVAREGCGKRLDGGVNLPTVGVSFYRDVEDAKGPLRRVVDVFR